MCVVVEGTPTVQTYESNGNFERGYITLKKYEGQRLNITSFATFNVTAPIECAEECIMTKLDKCKGFNIGKTNESDINSTEVVNCNLLFIDRYRLPSHRLVNDSNYNYYEPTVSHFHYIYFGCDVGCFGTIVYKLLKQNKNKAYQ